MADGSRVTLNTDSQLHISLGERVRADGHIAGCPACREFLETLLAVDTNLTAQYSQPGLDATFDQALKQRIRHEIPAPRPSLVPELLLVLRERGGLPVRIQQPAPIGRVGAVGPFAFHFALAIDAARGVGQSVEASHRNLQAAAFTDAVFPFANSLQGRTYGVFGCGLVIKSIA